MLPGFLKKIIYLIVIPLFVVTNKKITYPGWIFVEEKDRSHLIESESTVFPAIHTFYFILKGLQVKLYARYCGLM